MKLHIVLKIEDHETDTIRRALTLIDEEDSPDAKRNIKRILSLNCGERLNITEDNMTVGYAEIVKE